MMRRIIGGVLIVVLGLSLAFGMYSIMGNKDQKNPLQETSTKAKVSTQAKTQEQRVAYIKNFKIEVYDEPHQVVEVLIPQEFEGPYAAYNDLQKEQGFDLTKQKGKTCKQWTYLITKPTSKDGKSVVNLLVLDNKIIGADVTNLNTGTQQTLSKFAQQKN